MPTAAALLLFVVMLVYGELTYGGIFQYNTLSNLLINNAHLLILAVGMTFVILTGGIDLSVGAVIAFSSVAGVMLANAGWSPWLVILAIIGVGLLFGAIAGALVEFFDVQPFIATLATMFLGRGLASMLSTTPERLADGSPIRLLSQRITLVDGPRGQRPAAHRGRDHRGPRARGRDHRGPRARGRVLRPPPHPPRPDHLRDRRLGE